MLKDSGTRQEFSTGAVRDISSGKGRMDLLPMAALLEISKLYEQGCIKYGERNYTLGIPLERYIDSALRHFAKFMDNQQDEPHLIQAAWNILGLIETIIQIGNNKLPIELGNKMPFNEILLMDRKIKIKNEKKNLQRTKNRKSKNYKRTKTKKI